ncbi:MAG: Ig-like domain-containing protein [Leptospiraceae bacterium]|nr:Ig-like domain-containing protein [Leptospiraceae bacterium]
MNLLPVSIWMFLVVSNCNESNNLVRRALPFLSIDRNPNVLAVSPEPDSKDISSNASIKIIFNKEMKIQNCIQAFTTEPKVRGYFKSTSNTIEFTPSVSLENGTYNVSVSKLCEDSSGNDLSKPFSSNFTVGNEGATRTSPIVESIMIDRGTLSECENSNSVQVNSISTTINDACIETTALLRFSIAMEENSVKIATSITPNIGYSLSSSSDKKEFRLKFDSKLNPNTRYSISISPIAKSETNLPLKLPIQSSFLTRSEQESSIPKILSIKTKSGTINDCFNGFGVITEILNAELTNVCLGTITRNSIQIQFSEPMNPIDVQSSVSISPSFSFQYNWDSSFQNLELIPDQPYQFSQRYTMTINQNAKNSSGVKMQQVVYASFIAGGNFDKPEVLAFGVESQACAGTGSIIGGDWNLPSCYWDNSLPILGPSSYQFRAGDDGTGATGISNACLDVTSDNFVILFNRFMNIGSVLNSVSIERLSPPFTTIRLSSYSNSDCDTNYPYGCKKFILRYSEQEASCNGILFGNALTNGDFNLSRTDNMPSGIPIYTLRVNTSARDALGQSLKSEFNFSMEGK